MLCVLSVLPLLNQKNRWFYLHCPVLWPARVQRETRKLGSAHLLYKVQRGLHNAASSKSNLEYQEPAQRIINCCSFYCTTALASWCARSGCMTQRSEAKRPHFGLLRTARAPASTRSNGLCVIWACRVCVSSSSSSTANPGRILVIKQQNYASCICRVKQLGPGLYFPSLLQKELLGDFRAPRRQRAPQLLHFSRLHSDVFPHEHGVRHHLCWSWCIPSCGANENTKQ